MEQKLFSYYKPRVAKPEKVRTGLVFWSGKWPSGIGEKQARLSFGCAELPANRRVGSGLFFFGDFLLEEQKKVTKNSLNFSILLYIFELKHSLCYDLCRFYDYNKDIGY